MAENLVVKIDVITNLVKYNTYGKDYVNMSMELTNTGSTAIPDGNWKLYFNR